MSGRETRGRVSDPADFPPGTDVYARRDVDKLAKVAAARGAAIGTYAARVLDTDLPWTKMRAVYMLVGLCRTYGDDVVEQACAAALELDVISVAKISRQSPPAAGPRTGACGLPSDQRLSILVDAAVKTGAPADYIDWLRGRPSSGLPVRAGPSVQGHRQQGEAGGAWSLCGLGSPWIYAFQADGADPVIGLHDHVHDEAAAALVARPGHRLADRAAGQPVHGGGEHGIRRGLVQGWIVEQDPELGLVYFPGDVTLVDKVSLHPASACCDPVR